MEQRECVAFCGAGADAGKGFKYVNEILEGRRIVHVENAKAQSSCLRRLACASRQANAK